MTKTLTKTLFIKTYGCQMNVYDSARMAELLAPLGYRAAPDAEAADLVILNTCHIREKATEKVYSELGRLRRRQERAAAEGRRMTVAVAGCVAQAEGAEMLDRAANVDLVVGPQSYHRLPEMLAEIGADGDGPAPPRRRRAIDTEFPAVAKFDSLPEERGAAGPAAFLGVQEGCDKFCSFCVVPYTRGAEFSRPAAAILAEARALAAGGAREITLLGQNVNAWHGAAPDGGADWSLGRLIRALAEIPAIARLRYTTSHPRDMDDDLIAAHGEVPQLMPWLHLPVQSGADSILKAMNRRHTADGYRRIVDRLRAARPDLALSSDFIVGHPGESDADFAATLKLVGAVGYAQAYSFKYSPRPGTPAADRPDQVPEPVKTDRLQSLQQLLSAQQFAFNKAMAGTTLPVLVERPGSRPGQLVGRSPHMQAVHFDGPPRLIGEILGVRIRDGGPNSLSGQAALHDPDRREPVAGPAPAHPPSPAVPAKAIGEAVA